jgi:hypothetical protein
VCALAEKGCSVLRLCSCRCTVVMIAVWQLLQLVLLLAMRRPRSVTPRWQQWHQGMLSTSVLHAVPHATLHVTLHAHRLGQVQWPSQV